MPSRDQIWQPFCSVFPAGLDTESDPAALQDGFTPDGYGMDANTPGLLSTVSSIPTGSTRVTKTYIIGANTWTWYHPRLWRISSDLLYYNAPFYTASDFPQDIGVMQFNEDANALLTFFPFARDAMFVAKSTGGYMVPNATSMGGNFGHGNIQEAMKISDASHANVLDNIAFASNASGLFAWNGGDVKEITAKVRTSVSRFANKDLTLDIQKRQIVGNEPSTDSFVYDLVTDKLFYYLATASQFRYTSRYLQAPKQRPFTVTAVAFILKRSDSEDSSLTCQLRRDINDWEDEVTLDNQDIEDDRARLVWNIENPIQARKFQLRINSMSGNIAIRRIDVLAEAITDEQGHSE